MVLSARRCTPVALWRGSGLWYPVPLCCTPGAAQQRAVAAPPGARRCAHACGCAGPVSSPDPVLLAAPAEPIDPSPGARGGRPAPPGPCPGRGGSVPALAGGLRGAPLFGRAGGRAAAGGRCAALRAPAGPRAAAAAAGSKDGGAGAPPP